ncbi:hypothetical protein FRC10_007909 [Ceratobasidium sp. 414]|nr:hypothetical protein FRC10_007909 [Ceratobasidium sp. 414]
MDIIIAHPNGWGIHEQEFLRTAALNAGFADGGGGSDRIHFLEEMCASDCVQAGAIFVDKSAEVHFQEVLGGAGFPEADIKEYVSRGVKDFENTTKRAFRDASTDQSIEMAGTRLNNATIRVRRGRMTLPGTTVESFFKYCTKEIISSVNMQLVSASAPVSLVILVGGFGESPYLREQLKARFSSGCQIITTNEATSKAVADGALIWHCANSVVSRAPRYSFGIEVVVPLIHSSKEHRGRIIVARPSGAYVAGAWSQIVAKVTQRQGLSRLFTLLYL